jgi:hypothetical protein
MSRTKLERFVQNAREGQKEGLEMQDTVRREVWTIERGKKKKSFGRENDETKRRGQRSSSFILKKARILVQLQLQLTSLRT